MYRSSVSLIDYNEMTLGLSLQSVDCVKLDYVDTDT